MLSIIPEDAKEIINTLIFRRKTYIICSIRHVCEVEVEGLTKIEIGEGEKKNGIPLVS